MQEKPLLVVGIDPGTTIGYAVLDLDENLIRIDSSKHTALSSLISEITAIGKVILVGTDKKAIPGFVKKFAAKVGARIMHPRYDLRVWEKKNLAKGYTTGNYHQMDALASALFALKELSSLFKRIDLFVESYNKKEIRNKIRELVIEKRVSIFEANRLIEEQSKLKKSEEEDEGIIKKVKEEKQLDKKDFLLLFQKLKAAEREIKLLKQQNESLADELITAREKYSSMHHLSSKQPLAEEKAKKLLGFREKRIISFEKEIKSRNEEISMLKDKIKLLNSFFSKLNENIVLKRLSNLALEEFERKSPLLNILKGDILFVEDANIFNEKVVDRLKNQVEVIVYKKEPGKKLPFVFIDSRKLALLAIEENSNFVLANKEEFEREKNRIETLKKIIEDYKEERKASQ